MKVWPSHSTRPLCTLKPPKLETDLDSVAVVVRVKSHSNSLLSGSGDCVASDTNKSLFGSVKTKTGTTSATNAKALATTRVPFGSGLLLRLLEVESELARSPTCSLRNADAKDSKVTFDA